MKILVDIVHPADVHFFKQAIWEWKRRGHDVRITARDKDVTIPLLNAYHFDFTMISTQGKGLYGLAKELIVRDARLFRIARQYVPDVVTGFTGISVTHVGQLLRTPSIVFYDTEFARLSNLLTYPFATAVCTPSCYEGAIGRKHVRFRSYKELAYLHPRHFEPRPKAVRALGIDPRERFFLVRFVGWGAAHDRNEKGLTAVNKIRLVEELAKHGRVLVSSENGLPNSLKGYQLFAPVDQIHDIMAFADLYVGESATMASECAVLGVPAIFIAKTGRGYTSEQEREFGLLFNYSDVDQEHLIERTKQLLRWPNLKTEWQKRRERMLRVKIDPVPWMVDFVEKFVDGPLKAAGQWSKT